MLTISLLFPFRVLQEALLRDNIDIQSASIGVFGPEFQKKKGQKFKEDFPEAWYADKEKAFLQKQAIKDRADLATSMAKQTYGRMIKIFGKMVPDVMGLRPAFAMWKDWTDYDRSLHEDGGERYRLTHMSLMDVKEAVRAKSLGLTTDKLEAHKHLDWVEEEETETVHERVLKEAAMGRPTDEDVVNEEVLLVTKYAFNFTDEYQDRIARSIDVESKYSPFKHLNNLGRGGSYLLDEDRDSDDDSDDEGGTELSQLRVQLKWAAQGGGDEKKGDDSFDMEEEHIIKRRDGR